MNYMMIIKIWVEIILKNMLNIWKEEVNGLPLEKGALKKKRTSPKKKQILLED